MKRQEAGHVYERLHLAGVSPALNGVPFPRSFVEHEDFFGFERNVTCGNELAIVPLGTTVWLAKKLAGEGCSNLVLALLRLSWSLRSDCSVAATDWLVGTHRLSFVQQLTGEALIEKTGKSPTTFRGLVAVDIEAMEIDFAAAIEFWILELASEPSTPDRQAGEWLTFASRAIEQLEDPRWVVASAFRAVTSFAKLGDNEGMASGCEILRTAIGRCLSESWALVETTEIVRRIELLTATRCNTAFLGQCWWPDPDC